MKDKTIIVPVLVLYICLWIFTGTATSAVNASISMLPTPLGIFLLLAGIVILTYVCAKDFEKILRTIKAITGGQRIGRETHETLFMCRHHPNKEKRM